MSVLDWTLRLGRSCQRRAGRLTCFAQSATPNQPCRQSHLESSDGQCWLTHVQSICRQALMWRSLKHEFVLPFLGIYEDGPASQTFLVTPSMANGTLSQWRKMANPPASEVQKRVRLLLLCLVAVGTHLHRSSWKLPRAFITSIPKALFMEVFVGYFTFITALLGVVLTSFC